MATRGMPFGWWRGPLTTAAALLLAAPAVGAPRVVAPASGEIAVRGVAAVAAGPATARAVWYGIRLTAPAGALVIVNLPSGARVDAGGHAWLQALDQATAPRVLPPFEDPPACVGIAPEPTHAVLEPQPWPSGAPRQAAVAADAADAADTALAWGYPLGAGDQAYLAAGAGAVLLLEVGEPGVVLRLTGIPDDPFAGLEALALAGEVPVTLWHLGVGAPALRDVTTVEPADLDLTWLLGLGESDYPAAREAALDDGAGALFLLELSDAGRVHEGTVLPSGRPLIPSLVSSALGAGSACRDRILAWRADPVVPGFCAPGTLASQPGGAPCEPAPAACVGDLDLLLGLGRASAGPTVLTRWTGQLGAAPAPGLDPEHQGPASDGWVRAGTLQPAGCVTAGGTGQGGSLGWGGAATGGYANHGAGAVGGAGYYPDEGPVTTVDVTCAVLDDTSCGGGAEGDGCSSDSGGGEYDGDTCGGDSGGGCDSGGGDYDGDTCGGGSGGGCDSGGSYDGDTCSGGGGASGDCAVRRPRMRVRVSQVTLLGAALALWARRAGSSRRRRRAPGPPLSRW